MRQQIQVLEDGSVINPIHYSILVEGEERIACVPRLEHLYAYQSNPVWMRTGDPRVVTCMLCKGTVEWQELMAKTQLLERML